MRVYSGEFVYIPSRSDGTMAREDSTMRYCKRCSISLDNAEEMKRGTCNVCEWERIREDIGIEDIESEPIPEMTEDRTCKYGEIDCGWTGFCDKCNAEHFNFPR